MTLKKFGIISLILVLTIIFVVVLVNQFDVKNRDKIMSQLDTRLVTFDQAKQTAREVKTLISIRSQDDYLRGKQDFKKIMTTDLYNEYFPTENYEGGNKYFSIKETSVTGEIQGDNKFIMKLEISLVEEGRETPLTLLIYIENGIINRIQSLGI